MAKELRVVRLQSENILRLTAIDITPEGNFILIGGKNGAGKSSVLNSIAMALGGADMVPDEPLRIGESEGKIVVDLGDYIVIRKFTRDRVYSQCDSSIHVGGGNVGVIVGHNHTDACTWAWSDTRSTLMITNKEGTARFSSPQTMLDNLLGKLTFDPLVFYREEPARQREILRKIVGLDFSDLDRRYSNAYQQRTLLNKSYEIKSAQLLTFPTYTDAPDAEISIAEVSTEMLRAEELKQVAHDAERAVRKAGEQIDVREQQLKKGYGDLEQLKRQVADQEQFLAKTEATLVDERKTHAALIEASQAASSAVPDVTVIRTKITDAEEANRKFRVNQKHAVEAANVEAIGQQAREQDAIVRSTVEEKAAMLKAAQFPIPGLGLTDQGVTLNGLPLSQASSSEQLRVSVAIGIALNPTVKVLLIRHGNMLDDGNLTRMAEQADAANAQIWVEWVTNSTEDSRVSVMIEEGHTVFPTSMPKLTLVQPPSAMAIATDPGPAVDGPF